MNKLVLAFLVFLGTTVLMGQTTLVREPLKFLALGDSYTIGQSVSEDERWPVQLRTALMDQGIEAEPVTIIARTGWRTDDLQNVIVERKPAPEYNLVSLLIGVNDQYQGRDTDWYRPRFEELLNKAIELAGGRKDAVFVLSIPDYAYTPFGQAFNPYEISKELDEFNAVNKSITGSKGITYIDITPVSREGLINPGLVAADGLHPSGKMYAEWVSLILNRLTLKDKPLSTGAEVADPIVYLSPNPARDFIDFTLSDQYSGPLILNIYDAKGSLVGSLRSADRETLRFDLSGIDPGIYFYHIGTSSGKSARGKFIKL